MSLSDVEVAELKNLIRVKDLVRRTENPNPFVIIIIIIVVIMLMYILYVKYIKKTISGIWIDANETEHEIMHDKWSDSIMIDCNKGVVKGHLVVMYTEKKMELGIWMNDKINWVDGSVWHCLYGE